MTIQQLYLFNCRYLVIVSVAAVLTRATARRIAGALAGGAAVGVVALGIIALGEEVGWWHVAITWEPYFLAVLWIGVALSAFVFLTPGASPVGSRDGLRRGGPSALFREY